MIIDFKILENDKIVNNIYDLQIKEKIKNNTKIIDYSIKNKDKILQNYIDYCNYKASFTKNDYCFNLFCRCFNLYKNKNKLFFDLQKIKHNIDFIEKNKKQINDYNFNKNSLYQLFLSFKNK